ncbi:flippase [Halomarina rubra]|uniref:Flippase n=1 Tax=Halomarina rubra TaxID=2071873 RepID=A0ABD6AVX9_9EURY|nr:flippase [Halomarina rubra]
MSEDTSGLKSIFTGGWVLFAGLSIELLISLVGKIIIARYLGKVDYGGVALGVTILAMTTTVVLAGVHTGVGRFLPRLDREGEKHGLLWGAIGIVGMLSLVATAVLVASADWLATVAFDTPQLSAVITVLAVSVPAAAMMRLAIGVSQGYQRSLPKVFIRNLTYPISRIVGIGCVVLIGAGSLGVAGAYVCAYVIAAVVGLAYVYRWTDFDLSVPEETHIRELLSFSAPLFLTGALSLVLSDVDTLMLGLFSTQADVGVYNVVYPTAILLLAFLRSFRFIYMPRISELDKAEQVDRIHQNYQLVTKWLFLTTTPILVGFVVYSEDIIGLLYGPEYVSGGLALSLLAVGFYIHSVVGLNGTTLTSLGRTRVILYINVLAAAVNVVLNLLLIPEFSLVGAAVATTVSYVFINALYSLVLYRATRIVPVRTPLLAFSATTFGLATLLHYLATSMEGTASYLLYLVFLSAYLLTYIRIVGVEDEERRIFRGTISQAID